MKFKLNSDKTMLVAVEPKKSDAISGWVYAQNIHVYKTIKDRVIYASPELVEFMKDRETINEGEFEVRKNIGLISPMEGVGKVSVAYPKQEVKEDDLHEEIASIFYNHLTVRNNAIDGRGFDKALKKIKQNYSITRKTK